MENYKEKYENALATARKLYNEAKANEYTSDIEDYEAIFPELAESDDTTIPFGAADSELIEETYYIPEGMEAVIDGDKVIIKRKESEDEKIRKGIIKSLMDLNADWLELHGVTKENVLAWLEKQGEQKHVIMPKFNVGDNVVYTDPEGVKEYGVVQHNNSVVDAFKNKIAILVGGSILTYHDENELELVEQKPVEWTIDDAKCGDVLVYPDGTLAVFDYRLDGSDKGLYMSFLVCDSTGIKHKQTCAVNNATRATKEQIRILLNNLEKPVKWSKEDEDILGETIYFAENHLQLNIRDINWLKSLRPQKQWKPSDEQMVVIDTAINVLGKGTLNGKQLIELQESLRKLREG